jgi:short subunit dehydrogenase-like uncharacterized protein
VLLPAWLFVILPVCLISLPFKYYKKMTNPPPAPKAIELLAKPSSVTAPADRKYDLVLYGATGFTGKLCLEYLLKTYGSSVKLAIAGRKQAALETVLREANKLAGTDLSVDILVGDSSKPDTLRPIVDSTRVLISTVGPFDLYGTPVVNLCALYGTHYCDITGETDWVRKMIDTFDETAKASGAHIVHFCGHDCVPWDLTVRALADKLQAETGSPMTKVELFDEIRGAASGGTYATILHSLTDRAKVKTQLGYDPLMKTVPGKPVDAKGASVAKTEPRNPFLPAFSARVNKWVGFFVMAMVMTNCVRRSNAVNQYSGAGKLSYFEGRVFPSFAAAFVDLVNMVVFGTCLQSPWLTSMLSAYVLPAPGQGPSLQDMSSGFLRVTAVGATAKGEEASAAMYFDTDPGYRDTARMLVESGLALALDLDKISSGGGVWTPAACQGDALMQRLVKTGTQFEVRMGGLKK